MKNSPKRIVVKVGSNVITSADGLPDENVIRQISNQISMLHKQGTQVILVSSGAVAAGRGIFTFQKKTDTVVQRQVLSSLGQVRLISLYTEVFKSNGNLCSQVLVTREDFRSRTHYLNMQNCLDALLINNIIPIVNENDAVSVTELMFTDNDELAGLVSAMMNVDILILLTNVHGIYEGNPNNGGKIIREFDPKVHKLEEITGNGAKSEFGRGGILTKCHTAQKTARMGIPVQIAHGGEPDILPQILSGASVGTRFSPKKSTSNIKKWIAHSHDAAKGRVYVNEGARQSLLSSKATSLLPVGIMDIKGNFKKGDIVKIMDENGSILGLGMTKYGNKKAREVMGMKNQKPLIHYDHLYLH